jgi:hypothetical protein
MEPAMSTSNKHRSDPMLKVGNLPAASAFSKLVEMQDRLVPKSMRLILKMEDRMNPVPKALRNILEMEKRLNPGRILGTNALLGMKPTPEPPNSTRVLPMRVVKNVEPIWNVTGEPGPAFSIDTERTVPHYYIRRVPGSPGGPEVEVHFLGDAEREGVEPDAQLSDGTPVFFYTTPNGHLAQLQRDRKATGCFLLKQDGSVWELLGFEFFTAGDPAVGRLRRDLRARGSPIEKTKRLLDDGEKDLAAIKLGTELEKHLRALAVHASISTESNGMRKKADRMNSELAAAGCYSQLDQKNVTAWLDLRNKAAHGHSDAFTAQQVAVMLEGVRDFIARHPA